MCTKRVKRTTAPGWVRAGALPETAVGPLQRGYPGCQSSGSRLRLWNRTARGRGERQLKVPRSDAARCRHLALLAITVSVIYKTRTGGCGAPGFKLPE